MQDALLYLNPTDTALEFQVYSYNSIFKNKKLATARFDLVNDTKDSVGREHTLNLNPGTATLKLFVRVFMADRNEMGTSSLPRAYLTSNLRINVENDDYLPGATIRGTVAVYAKDLIKSGRLSLRLETLATSFKDFDAPLVENWTLVHESGATILNSTSINRGLSVWAFEIVLPVLDSSPTFEWRGSGCKTRLVAALESNSKTKKAIKSLCVHALSSDLNGLSLQQWKRERAVYIDGPPFEAPFEAQLKTLSIAPSHAANTKAYASVPLWPSASTSTATSSDQKDEKKLWVVPPPFLSMPSVLVSTAPPSPVPELEDVSLTWLQNFQISALDDAYNSFVMSNFRVNFKTKLAWRESAYLVQEVSTFQSTAQTSSTETIHRFRFDMNLMPQTFPGKEDDIAPTLMMRPTGKIDPPPPSRSNSDRKTTIFKGPEPFLLNLRSHHLPGLMTASTYVEITVTDPSTQAVHVIARKPFYDFGVGFHQYDTQDGVPPQSPENIFKIVTLSSSDPNGRNTTSMEAWEVAELLAPTKRSWDPKPLYVELRLPMRIIMPTITVDDTTTAESCTGTIADGFPSIKFNALPLLPVTLHDLTYPTEFERINSAQIMANLNETVIGTERTFKGIS